VGCYIVKGMSAKEIIEELKRLPESDRQKVREYLQVSQTVEGTSQLSEDPAQYASDSEFEKAADEVFKKYDNLFRKLAQ
jgi:hypothetical protein